MNANDFITHDLGHLGLIAGMCNRIGLIELVDEIVGPTERDVSVGQAVQALVLNGMGFVGRPLYLTPEFYRNKPVDLLIGPDITADQLNSYSLGRALDRLFDRGVTDVFAHVASRAIHKMGIAVDVVHLDSTSFSLHGEYEFAPDEQAETIEVTRGYSRDHRPDLKQVVVSLICTHQAGIPTWLTALSGNTADVSSFPETIQAYLDQLKADQPPPLFVADSALYSADTIKKLGAVEWVTRVPASVGLVKDLYQSVDKDDMQPMTDSEYRMMSLCSIYGGVNQRWIMIFSESAYKGACKRLDKRVGDERAEAQKGLRKLGRREYPSPEAAQAAVETLADSWRFHTAEVVSFTQVPHYTQPGRPARGQSPDYITWQPVAEAVADEEAIAIERAKKGKYILATNVLDGDRLPPDKLLETYKAQTTTAERGFRFLKDPLFFAHSLFLDKPSRIAALLMVMGLCLLIYALAEHLLRTRLVDEDETVPDQKGNPTQRITMRRVFQVFEGIHVLIVIQPDGTRLRFIVNVSDLHRKILRLMGPAFEACYEVPP